MISAACSRFRVLERLPSTENVVLFRYHTLEFRKNVHGVTLLERAGKI